MQIKTCTRTTSTFFLLVLVLKQPMMLSFTSINYLYRTLCFIKEKLLQWFKLCMRESTCLNWPYCTLKKTIKLKLDSWNKMILLLILKMIWQTATKNDSYCCLDNNEPTSPSLELIKATTISLSHTEEICKSSLS